MSPTSPDPDASAPALPPTTPQAPDAPLASPRPAPPSDPDRAPDPDGVPAPDSPTGTEPGQAPPSDADPAPATPSDAEAVASTEVSPAPATDPTPTGNPVAWSELGLPDSPAQLPATFANPGLPPEHPRRGDRDPAARRRAVRQAVVLFSISILGSIGFLVAYFVYAPDGSVASVRLSTVMLGLGIFLGLVGIGTGAVHWAKAVMDDREHVEERHPQRTDDARRAETVATLKEGAEASGIARRPLLKGALITSVALVPLSFVVPLVGNLGGDWDVRQFGHTIWRSGRRLCRDPEGTPIRAADLTIGSVFHVIPEDLASEDHPIEEKSKAAVLLVRMDPRDLRIAPGREDWSYDGIVAYSKICTHVGCPVALYERQTHHVLCPCHQSTFDAADGARVIFGPAKRALPQLPITVDAQGYLVARSDFTEPVGPSYWERKKW